MFHGEHSAILLTFIKLPFVIKSFVLSILGWPFYTGFTVLEMPFSFMYVFVCLCSNISSSYGAMYRVKSGIFGQTTKFGQRSCLFHTSNIGINNKLTKQTVKS